MEGRRGSIFADMVVFVSRQQNLGSSKTGVYAQEAEHVQGGPVERQYLVAIILTIQDILVEIFSTATMADRNVDKYTIVIANNFPS